MMDGDNKVVVLSDFEQRIMVRSLNDSRTSLIKGNCSTEDIDDLLLKVIDAPSERERRWKDRDAR